ncbi:MAG: hypothetical protein K2O03_08965, partial [Lachnospiraceae bacterium]|nr:hypothetical protein [Lachnospiraceae bacterium]
MYDENGFVVQENNEVYTECKVVEPQDLKKKKGKKRFAKWTAGILCAALLAGGGFAAGSAFGTGAKNPQNAQGQGTPGEGISDAGDGAQDVFNGGVQ